MNVPNALKKNAILISQDGNCYTELRHIVARGTNREIGRSLAELARESYQTELVKYRSTECGSARLHHMREHYPILAERMRGVAECYGLAPNDEEYDTSSLYYPSLPSSCSMVYFPGAVTANGHATFARNSDFYVVTLDEFLGLAPRPGQPKLFSKNFALEMYPDAGYSTLVLSSLDLLNGTIDGINSQGLSVSLLADTTIPNAITVDLTSVVGLSILQLGRLVLETAATVAEAKDVIRASKVFMPFDTMHMLVGDRSGESFIADFEESDLSARFTDNSGAPQIMTNHALSRYPDMADFPDVPLEETYNTFNRYCALEEYMSMHSGKYTEEDQFEAMARVYGFSMDKSEGAARDLPLRTLWVVVADLDEMSMKAKFYERDGVGTELIFSKPMEFGLRTPEAAAAA